MALAFVEAPEGPDRFDPLAELLPGVLPLGRLRAVALTLRLCRSTEGRGPLRRVAFATYAPFVDLPGSGRMRWEPESAANLRSQRSRLALPPVYRRLAALLAQGLLDRPADERLDAPELPGLRWAFTPAAPPPPAPGLDDAEWLDLSEPIDGLCTWPHELLARADDEPGGPAPLPLRILADTRGLRGDLVRNPAGLALSRKGFDPYLGRTPQEYRREAGGAGGPTLAKRSLEVAAAAAGIDEADGEGRHRALLDEVLVASGALGCGLGAILDDADARLAADERLVEPGLPVWAATAPRIQVVCIAGGVPTAAACTYGSAVMALDAAALGDDQAPWYAAIRPRQSRRGGRPDRPSRLARGREHA